LLFSFTSEYVVGKVQEDQVGLKLNGIHLLLVYADGVYVLGSNINTIKNKDICEELSAFHYVLSTSYDTDCIENATFNSSVAACIFVASGTFTVPLHSNSQVCKLHCC
jgi:hypothetical protein